MSFPKGPFGKVYKPRLISKLPLSKGPNVAEKSF
jgi:hypothetical protein